MSNRFKKIKQKKESYIGACLRCDSIFIIETIIKNREETFKIHNWCNCFSDLDLSSYCCEGCFFEYLENNFVIIL